MAQQWTLHDVSTCSSSLPYFYTCNSQVLNLIDIPSGVAVLGIGLQRSTYQDHLARSTPKAQILHTDSGCHIAVGSL